MLRGYEKTPPVEFQLDTADAENAAPLPCLYVLYLTLRNMVLPIPVLLFSGHAFSANKITAEISRMQIGFMHLIKIIYFLYPVCLPCLTNKCCKL